VGLNFSPGTVMILFTVAVLLVSRRSFEEYGLTLKGWRYNLNVGLLWGVLIVLAAGVVVQFTLVHFDPLHPPDLTWAVMFSSGEVILTLLLVVFLMRERSLVRRVPPVAGFLVLVGFVSLPVVLAILFHRGVLNMLLRVLWLLFGAGFGEEIFFRGYIQSRLNQCAWSRRTPSGPSASDGCARSGNWRLGRMMWRSPSRKPAGPPPGPSSGTPTTSPSSFSIC
jgi:membrane protease YdiL (CAAX protease family)